MQSRGHSPDGVVAGDACQSEGCCHVGEGLNNHIKLKSNEKTLETEEKLFFSDPILDHFEHFEFTNFEKKTVSVRL